MKTNFWNKTLSAVTVGFLFLCVSCSHTKTTVSSLEGLSSEASPVEESTEDKVANTAPAQEVASSEAVAPVEEVAGGEEATNTEAVATKEEVAPVDQKNEAAFEVPEAVTENPLVATSDEPSAVSPNTDESASEPAVSADSSPNKKERDINSKKRRKHRRHRRHRGKTADNLDIEELLNAYSTKVDKSEKGKPELASADLTSFVEKNLFPIALFMVGALIATFLAVRRNRKTDTPL